MAKQAGPTIRVISHGPGCLDGVVAAAAVARFYAGHRVVALFAGNVESDRTILSARAAAGDEIWITDLSWTSTATAEHLNRLAQAGARIYWIDHHRSAVSRLDAPEFKVNFAGRLLSEEFSAARLTFNFLKDRAGAFATETAREAFERLKPIVDLADDHDRWVHRLPDSADWALAVESLGSVDSYREIVRMSEPKLSRKLKLALDAGREAMRRSLELARATLVEKQTHGGLKLRVACCFGYSSEVAAGLYEGQHQTVVALFDLRSQGVSLRRSADCEFDLSRLAHSLGGGGHPAAAGFTYNDLSRAPAQRLAEFLAERLTES